MAAKGHHQNQTRKFSLFPLLSLLIFASIFLAFSHFNKASISFSFYSSSQAYNQVLQLKDRSDPTDSSRGSCNYSDGKWIYKPISKFKPRYDSSCKEIFKGWNCLLNGKSDAAEIAEWSWKSNDNDCELPPFDPVEFLQTYRDTNIGFVGDSLKRNMFVSLFCALKRVSSEVKKWRLAGADRGFAFLHYNLTIAYHRTNLLASYGWDSCLMQVVGKF